MPSATPLAAPPFQLRPYEAGDEALYAALFTDAEVMRAMGAPFDRPRAERAAASVRHQQQPGGRFRHWVIEYPEGVAGLLGLALHGERWAEGEAELGVLLWPAWRARGAATAAILAVRPWAFRVAGLAGLTCHHAEGHAPAAALMRRVGFVPARPREGSSLPCAWACRRDADAPLG